MRLPSAPDERRSRMIDIRGLLVVWLIGLVVITAAGCGDASRATASPPAAVVKVEPVVERDVPISVEYVGTLVGYINAQIRARVAGHLVSQNYTEGSPVKAGDLLFQVDPRPFQTAADQADAKLNLAESQLSQSKAQVGASQAQVEQAIAKVAQDEAQVKRAEATQRQTELDANRYTPRGTPRPRATGSHRVTPVGGGPERAPEARAAADFGRRHRLFPPGTRSGSRPTGGRYQRHRARARGVSEPGQSAAARPVRQGPRRRRGEEGRALDPAACRPGRAGHSSGRRGPRRRHGRHPHGQGRCAGWLAVDGDGGAEARRAGRRRGRRPGTCWPESPAGGEHARGVERGSEVDPPWPGSSSTGRSSPWSSPS